jgi:hypothetical protein
VGPEHRYLISRLSLQVFYLWRHVSSTAPQLILWWSNFEILVAPPPPPQLSLHRRAALSSNSNGTLSVYSREPKKQSILWDVYMDLRRHLYKYVQIRRLSQTIVFRYRASILILWITYSPPSQHINSCSSLHRRNGARTLGGKPSLIIWGMVGGKGKAYLA